MLAGALADRLLIARSSASLGRVDVSPRCVTLLQPLLMGWATLSARGFLAGICPCTCLALQVVEPENERKQKKRCLSPSKRLPCRYLSQKTKEDERKGV